jgi:hypothetical protein
MVFDGIPSLLPMKQYLSVFNTVVTVLLNAAPIANFINVSKGKEPYTNIPPMMLIVNLGNNIIWGCYWIRQSEYISCLCSSLSGVFSTVYIIWYSFFASKKNIAKLLLYILAQIVVQVGLTLFFYSEILSLQIVGTIIIFITLLQYIAPAQNMVKAFREKNDKLIPIVPTICGCLCSGGWFLFGLIIGDINCIIPNGLGLLSSILTALVWVYIKGNKKKEDKEEELGETLNSEEK